MKRVVCKSGLIGWRCRLHENYANRNEWQYYSDLWGLANRLGFTSPEAAWAANPTIEGSVDPSDFCTVNCGSKKKRAADAGTQMAKQIDDIDDLQRHGFEVNMEIVFSTAHISAECANAMSKRSRDKQTGSISNLCIYGHGDYGFRVFVPTDETFETEFAELNRI